jgi:L-asparaginase/Glu-tRNA(Gln) amidotransferase subunit D
LKESFCIPHVFKENVQNMDQSKEISAKLMSRNRKVLIICTGGTITMFPTKENGLKVQKGAIHFFLK